MFTIFRYHLTRSLGQILGWGLSLAVLGGYLASFYETIAGQQEALMGMIKNYPPEMFAFFGDMTKIFTPSGFLDTEFFSYMPIIIGFFAVLAGSGLLASDEENGTLDLVLSHPISRASLFAGRLAAFILATLAILALAWLGFVLVIPGTNLDISLLEMALPFLSLFALLALFGMLSLLLSMLLPSRRLAAMIAGILLVGSFFITSLARVDPDLKSISDFSPLSYYQGGIAIEGLKWSWLAGLLGFAVLFALLAGWQFVRRDIRVGGEGGWSLPGRSMRRRRATSA